MNQARSRPNKNSSLMLVGGGIVVVAILGCFAWNRFHQPGHHDDLVVAPKLSKVPTPDLNEPAESFQTYQYVLQTGGCEITRPAAIGWLDSYEREHSIMSDAQADCVLGMIEQGGHASWDHSYRQHIYNSAFNALHLSHVGERFTRDLQKIALQDADEVMRLYALQHLGMQRQIGHLTGVLADEIHAMLESLARKPGEEVAGTAIQILASWNGSENSKPDLSIQQLALATAADPSRSVDIRVTAIHAAGSASLPLARTIASDSTQPVMLRKAAISRIGDHGDTQDISELTALRGESIRIAQAAEPAIKAIQFRLDHPNAPEPTPY